MIISVKDTAKLIGISIISCCAVLVCTMFLNFYLDIVSIKESIVSEEAMLFYEAQVMTSKVVCLVSGGCLLATSVVMLFFYIKHYIDTHKKMLGVLKALGYSNLKIARSFWVFGSSILLGTAVGFLSAFLLMPVFYKLQNEDGILPEFVIHFHPELFLYLVLLPAAAFALLAICYACIKLRCPVQTLLKGSIPYSHGLLSHASRKNRRHGKKAESSHSFLEDLRRDALRSKKTLVFFILFSSFCFSAMTQMSAQMKDFSSVMMGAMMLGIGILLACTTLFLAITTVIKGNTQTIAMMRIFGYSQKQCCHALLGCYRPVSYLGFAIGTVYQYALLKLMVSIVFKDIAGVPEYTFDVPIMLISLAAFVVVYELVMYYYAEKIKKISVKEIMLE